MIEAWARYLSQQITLTIELQYSHCNISDIFKVCSKKNVERTFAASLENGTVTKEKAKLPTEVVKNRRLLIAEFPLCTGKEFYNVVTRNLV